MHSHLVTAVTAFLGLTTLVSANPIRKRDIVHGKPHYVYNATRANAVKQTFQIAWDGYYKYAFGHDSLQPITNTYSDDRNGWGASAIDAFSTALVQGNWEVVNTILAYVPTINFDNTTTQVSLFETTIRYLGGLLSAHDFLTGPLKGKSNNTALVPEILKQATNIANNLKIAFTTPSGVPDNNLMFNPPRRTNSSDNGIAGFGTLVLEWTRLSDLTGNPEYANVTQKAESYLLHPLNPELGEPFPGLIGTNVDLNTGKFLDGSGGWVGGSDSFFEYLIKMYIYDPVRFGEYKDRWVVAVESTMKYLASHPTTDPDLTYLAIYNNRTLSFVSEHLACFDGGNIILGGLTLQEPRYVEFGLALVDSCYQTYSKTATGIGPEIFQWVDNATPLNASNNQGPNNAADEAFYENAGFWITNPSYVLRPEVLESIYYAYRATGDTKYQDMAWEAYLAINSTCAVGSGYSSINNVNEKSGGGFQNFQESFFFAEVLKYSYLIHAEDAVWQVQPDRTNEFVFNTEAHPLRLAAGFERAQLEHS